MSTAELTTYTADDLLRMPDGDRYELVGGHLVEIDMGARSGWIGGQLYAKLMGIPTAEGAGGPSQRKSVYNVLLTIRKKVRRPGTFYVCRGRFENEEVPAGFVRLVPDLAVEVISHAVDHKVQEYLEAGIRLVWVINPEGRTVTVYRAGGGDPSRLNENDELTGEDVLPGFQYRITELFPAGITPVEN